MGPKLQQWLRLVSHYVLDDRYDEVRQWREMGEAGFVDEQMAEMLIHAIQPAIEAQERRPNYLKRAPTMEELYPKEPPSFVCGHLSERPEVPVGVSLDGPVHCVVAGKTGFGKTMAIRLMIQAVANNNRKHPETPTSLVVLDRAGNDYGDVEHLIGAECLHLDVHGDLRIGLNGPEGLPPHIWINHLATNLCAPAGLRFSWVTCANMIRWCVGHMNKALAHLPRYPDFETLLKVARGPCGRRFTSKLEYLDSFIQVLEGIVQASGNLFHTFRGLDLHRDILSKGKHVVISMPNLQPSWLRQFIGYTLLDSVLLPLMYSGTQSRRCRVIFVIEEADSDVSVLAEQAFPDGMSPIARNHRMGREFGVGDILGLGSLSKVGREVLDSADHHFIFRMTSPESLAEGARTLLLPRRGDELLAALEAGECLVRLPGYPHTFLATMDFMQPNPAPPSSFDTHEYVPSVELSEIPELVQGVSELHDQIRAAKLRKAKASKRQLSDAAAKLLTAAAEHPFVRVAELWRLIGGTIGPDARKKAVAELRNLKLAKFDDLRVGKVLYKLILLEAAGWEYLGRKQPHIRGRGGAAHVTVAHLIAQAMAAQGFVAEVEWLVPSTTHHADVACQAADGSWDIYEIVVDCDSNIIDHLYACLLGSTVVSHVVIVAGHSKQLAELRAEIESDLSLCAHQSRIRYETISKYMKEV